MLKVENLSKHYRGVPAVQKVSFEVKPGDIVGFIGPNGAGKSTTMRMLAGFLQPDSGQVTLEMPAHSIQVAQNPQQAARHIGYLPEQGGLYGDLTVLDYVLFMAEAHRLANPVEAAVNTLALVNAQGWENRLMDTLSKGMRQRVLLAGALVHQPQLLILDEPTDGLDPNQKKNMRDVLKKLAKDRMVIVSTHILEEVSLMCNRVVVIAAGQVTFNGTRSSFMKGYASVEDAFYTYTQHNKEQAA